MSHETVRDLRTRGQAADTTRVRGPVRDRLSTEPEPDNGVAGESDGRPLRWRLAAAALVVVLGVIAAGLGVIGVLVLAGDYAEPAPARCVSLRDEAIERQDITVIYEMDRLGCPNPPYDAVRWP